MLAASSVRVLRYLVPGDYAAHLMMLVTNQMISLRCLLIAVEQYHRSCVQVFPNSASAALSIIGQRLFP
jgi:hypothetical protein